MKKLRLSQNYYRIEDFINNKFQKLENEHFSKWIFMKVKPLNVNFLSGRTISYEGFGFEGSPHNIFWSQDYVPAYILSFCKEGVELVKNNAIEFDLNLNHCLEEFEYLFIPRISKAYNRMADISSTLLGNGYPLPKKNVSGDIGILASNSRSIINAYKFKRFDNIIWYIEWLGKRLLKIRIFLGIIGANTLIFFIFKYFN